MFNHRFSFQRFSLTFFFVFLLTGFTCASAQQNCKEKYAKIRLSAEDKAVLEYLDALSEDRNEFIKSIVVLLAISEVDSAPKSIGDLSELLIKNEFSPVSDDQFAKAAKGLVQLSAKPTYEALTLIVTGKANYVDKKFSGYKAKGDVLRLLQCLQQRYHQLVTSGK